MNKHIKTLIKERKRQKLSVYKVAQETGLSLRAITYWETGQRHPTLDSFERYASVLGYIITLSPTK